MEKSKSRPEVTVIIPMYNTEKYIGGALESILRQSGDILVEIIVIDDNSKDSSERIVQGYRDKIAHLAAENQHCKITELRYHKNKRNSGVAESRNYGIRNAKGSYIAFLDADDWWSEDKLASQLKFMKEKKAVLCCTGRELMNADGTTTGKAIGVPEEITYKMLLKTNRIPCSSVLVRTEVAQEFYMCHDELHEDYILWLQILKKYGPAYGINEKMLKCRMSQGGKSRNKIKSARMHFGVYRYMGISIIPSCYYMCCYMIHGVLKYSNLEIN